MRRCQEKHFSLNRLATATEGTGPAPPAGIPNAAQGLFSDYCWSYDQWGNRTQQLGANTAFPSTAGGPQICNTSQPQFTYNTDNHILTSPTGAPVYDAAGEITTGTAGNVYLYDAEGRICAVATAGMDGMGPSMTGYVYDAAGNRVAKGPITKMSCDPTQNGFETSGEESDYIHNQQGRPVTKLTVDEGVMTWNYTNVYADGQLFATYDAQGLHFDLDDWLGTRRVTTDYAGVVEQTCASLPYGDQLNCTGSVDAPNEQHFTGKTHDTESGLDYFGARYYSENDARFMSPDWSAKVEPVPYAKLDNPQSLNLYEYMLDSPLDGVDPDGHQEWVITPEGIPLPLPGGYAKPLTPAQADQIGYSIHGAFEKLAGFASDVRIATKLITSTTSVSSSILFSSRRPGTRGKPDHQQTVREEAAKIGGQSEIRIPTPGGAKEARVGDAVAKDANGNVTAVTQAIRPTPAGNVPLREQKAAQDIQNATGVKPKLVPVRPLPQQQ